MVETLIRSVSIMVIFGFLFYLVNNRIKEWLEDRRSEKSLKEDEQRVKLIERENKAKLDAATADELAQKEKAKLLQEAAESKVTADIANNSDIVAARIEGEKRIIEARAKGRAQAAKERAASGSDESAALMANLVHAYETFLYATHTNRYTKFDDWLGSIDINDFR